MRPFPAIFALLLAATLSLGQTPQNARILRAIDFEERRLGNEENLPMHWMRVEGPGLPQYISGMLASDKAHSGSYSFRLDLNGGSLLYRYDPRKLPVTTGAHYRIDAHALTTPLVHARARLSACFADVDLRPLPSTLVNSELYAATQEGEPWKLLSVQLTADSPAAAYLLVEIGLLQPEQYAPAKSDGHGRELFSQEIRGRAWFDDITVWRVPQVTLHTGRAGNLIQPGQERRLEVNISDSSTDPPNPDLAGQFTITDAGGRCVYQHSAAMGAGAPAPRQFLDLPPDLSSGWYHAALDVSNGGVTVASTATDFILLPPVLPQADIAPDARFGLVATSLPWQSWAQLPAIVQQLGAGGVKIALWPDGDTPDPPSQNALAAADHLLDELGSMGIRASACLLSPGPRPAELISRYAAHITEWQLGADGSDGFVTNPAMRQAYTKLKEEFTPLSRSSELAIPWPALSEVDQKVTAPLALAVPASVAPAALPQYVAQLKQRGHGWLTLAVLEKATSGRELRIRDLAQRIVYCLSADAPCIDVPLPFSVRPEGQSIEFEPDEMALILRTLFSTLGGAAFKGRVPVAHGVLAFLFDKGGTGILCLWNSGESGPARQIIGLDLNVGRNPRLVDLWGNSTPLLSSAQGRAEGQVALAVGAMPIFLIDVDASLAQFRASVALDRPLVESSFHPHRRTISFTNPYAHAISGTLRLKGPAGWAITPASMPFNLNASERFEREISIEFPYNSLGGAKVIAGEFALQGNANTAFTVPIELKLGLSDVSMQTTASRQGGDIIVQQSISNYADHPVSYSSFVLLPGQSRQEKLVSNLAAGQTTLKQYRFSNVPKLPTSTRLRVGLRELEGTRILNDELAVP